MDTITELTEKKIKQVTFKILEQAGNWFNQIKVIQPQIIDKKVMAAIALENPTG
jgi:hypothetical protein